MVNSSWRSLLETANGLTPWLHGDVRNFLLQTEGEASIHGSVSRIRAFVQSPFSTQAPCKVVLQLRTADLQVVRRSAGLVKAIQAVLQDESPWPVLDVSGPDAVLVTTVQMDVGEQIRVAEVFSGGLAGWSQAIAVLHDAKIPVHTEWTLDWDPQVVKYLQMQKPEVKVLCKPQDLDTLTVDEVPHLQVDAYETWWMRMQTLRPIQLMTISAPCPSWSGAAKARGLQTREGGLLLQLAGVCGSLAIPLVLIEQVEGFSKHPDFPAVSSAWEEAGYIRRWSNTLDLMDCLPVSRRRYLAVMQHRSCPHSALPLPGEAWTSAPRMTLAQAEVIFPLPKPIRKPLIPTQEILDKYLDPSLLPKSRARGQALQPANYRLRSPHSVATCFMARYGSQDCLPQELLETRGLMGCLFTDHQQVRFFSSAEISAMHGMQNTLWISQDVALNNQVAGNAIAVPHALAALGYALRACGVATRMSISETVALAHHGRLTAANSAFLPLDDGWILCRYDRLRDRLIAALPRMSFRSPLAGQASRLHVFVDPEGCQEVTVDMYASLEAVMAHLGLTPQRDEHCIGDPVQVAELPRVHSCGMHKDAASNGMTTILTTGGRFVVTARSPLTCLQVLEACQDEPDHNRTCALYAIDDTRQGDVFRLPAICIAVHENLHLPNLDFVLSSKQVATLAITCGNGVPG